VVLRLCWERRSTATPQALEAIAAGKSVLVEKPFMDTAAQAQGPPHFVTI
jgi:hypothetical protein